MSEYNVTFEEFLEALKAEVWITPGKASRLLKTLNDTHLAALLTRAMKDKDASIRNYATQALSAVKSDWVIDLLVEAISDADDYNRRLAIYYLYWKNVNNKKITGTLIQALGDSEMLVRHEAARTLGKIQDQAAIEPLLKLLDDPDIFVRKEAAHTLGELNARQAIEPIKYIITVADVDDKGDFILALGKFQDKTTADFILSFSDHEDTDVQLCVMMAMEKVGEPQHIPLLEKFLESEDKSVRETAEETINKLRSLENNL